MSIEILNKKCSKCGETKDISCFYKCTIRENRCGYRSQCRDCALETARTNRRAKIEQYRNKEKIRANRPERKVSDVLSTKRWRQSDKRHVRAHQLVAKAIKSGELKKEPCKICGVQKAFAHHDDYDFPLKVIFLCQTHHMDRHRELRAKGIRP